MKILSLSRKSTVGISLITSITAMLLSDISDEFFDHVLAKYIFIIFSVSILLIIMTLINYWINQFLRVSTISNDERVILMEKWINRLINLKSQLKTRNIVESELQELIDSSLIIQYMISDYTRNEQIFNPFDNNFIPTLVNDLQQLYSINNSAKLIQLIGALTSIQSQLPQKPQRFTLQ